MADLLSLSDITSYDCSQNQGTTALLVAALLLSVATISVACRIYVRIHLRRSLGWDDYTITASLVSGIIAFALYVKLVQSGMGQHLVCLTYQNIVDLLKWSQFAQIFISICLGLTKISVCVFLIRLLEGTRRGLAIGLWVLIGFVILSHLVQAILFLVQCRPLDAVWNELSLGPQCFSTSVVVNSAYVNYSLDCFADFLCVCIAIYVIRRLQMNIQTKVALCCLMSLGLFTAACVIVDAVTLGSVLGVDKTWAIAQPAMWAAVGAFIGITIASIPILKPLFNKVFEFTVVRTYSSSKYLFWKISGGSGSSRGSKNRNKGSGENSAEEKRNGNYWSAGNIKVDKTLPPLPSEPVGKKSRTKRHDLESYDTEATFTQNSNESRWEPEVNEEMTALPRVVSPPPVLRPSNPLPPPNFSRLKDILPPPNAYWPERRALRSAGTSFAVQSLP